MDKTAIWRNVRTGAMLLTLVALLSGCAGGVRSSGAEPELARARSAYAQAVADPAVNSLASTALADAHRALQRAEAAAEANASPQEQAHLAYIAERKVDIARAKAREAAAKQEIESAMRQRASEAGAAENATAEESRREALRAHAKAQSAREAALAAELAESQGGGVTDSTQQQLESDLAALEVPARETDRGFVATLDDEMFTGADSTPLIVQKLQPVIEYLKAHPKREVIIEGYTDNNMPVAESLSLSQARAESVQTELVRRGIARGRILARGYGPDFPVADNDTAAGRQRNRRVDIVITPAGQPARQQLR